MKSAAAMVLNGEVFRVPIVAGGADENQGSTKAVAQQLGVSRPTLYNWKNQLLGHEVPASMKCHADLPLEPQRAELERQLETLRRDVRNLQLEHDLLKKANELLKMAWASTCNS